MLLIYYAPFFLMVGFIQSKEWALRVCLHENLIKPQLFGINTVGEQLFYEHAFVLPKYWSLY